MADSYRSLGAANLGPPAARPLGDEAEQRVVGLEEGTIVYEVPAATQAIIKLIVITSDADEQNIVLRGFSPELGEIPLLGPVVLGISEWAEWSGSLTLGTASQIVGYTSSGTARIAVYGMERLT